MHWRARTLFFLTFLASAVLGVARDAGPFTAYIGTYTAGKSQGIYVTRLDPATGQLSAPRLAARTRNPSFLALHPNGKYLYAVGEVDELNGARTGAVSAFRIEPGREELTLLDTQPSGGTGPCHVAVDATGQCLLVANYGSGSIAALPIRADGQLGEAVTRIQHHGSSVDPKRQEGPHAHFIVPSPDNRFALVCDLGLDEVLSYRLNPAKATLVPNTPPATPIQAGSGPRHLAFAPDGRFAYVISEMGGTVTACRYDKGAGTLQQLQTVSTLPQGWTNQNSCAEVQIAPSGRFLYASNRGHDSIAVFARDRATGRLQIIGHQAAGIKTPRHFTLDPTGHWLLVENQATDNIVTFRLDEKTGLPAPAGEPVAVGSPVCLVFAR